MFATAATPAALLLVVASCLMLFLYVELMYAKLNVLLLWVDMALCSSVKLTQTVVVVASFCAWFSFQSCSAESTTTFVLINPLS